MLPSKVLHFKTISSEKFGLSPTAVGREEIHEKIPARPPYRVQVKLTVDTLVSECCMPASGTANVCWTANDVQAEQLKR